MDKVFVVNGCTSHSERIRERNDYYATPPIATKKLLEVEKFDGAIWECACGEGHISDILKNAGYTVYSSDILDRGYKETEIINFLDADIDATSKNIVTNPPYKYVSELWEKACKSIAEGGKVAFMLKLTFLEGKARKELFKKYPPSRVHVFSERINCAMNGEFDKFKSSAIAHAWFVYDYGNKNNPIVDWI